MEDTFPKRDAELVLRKFLNDVREIRPPVVNLALLSSALEDHLARLSAGTVDVSELRHLQELGAQVRENTVRASELLEAALTRVSSFQART